ncbi:putative transporter C1529,01 [Talaromyces islandicus]|uniref:Putative transporter C1529,01 n=1 Tax=Talaromyces islandicus TaxID=28573 RepID=A0A0U1LVQ9_TALIS|nr:putative transporter C1529,01 [Talaromyces islandicus]
MSYKQETESGAESPVDSGYGNSSSLKIRGEVILVPRPSDDSRDPLNWGQAKKYIVLSILTLAAFTGHALALANQLGLIAQANLYHKSLTEISYTGVVIVLVFCFIEETGFTRKDGRIYPPQPSKFIPNRIATFFPGTAVAHVGGFKEASHSALAQFLIGISPVSISCGFYLISMCGWFVSLNTLLGVFLQNSVEEGGYGFTPQQSAAFTFTLWIGMFAAQIWGYFVNDRVPLSISKRASGAWKPEYRLHALWIPSVVLMPAGLGLFGSSLQYQLHYMVLAAGAFLVTTSSNMAVPVVLNYLVECFMSHPIEVNCIMSLYRLGLGLGSPFFIEAWVNQVGVGWVFGMMAFCTLASFVPIVVLMKYGHALRLISFGKLNKDEEGVQIVSKEEL